MLITNLSIVVLIPRLENALLNAATSAGLGSGTLPIAMLPMFIGPPKRGAGSLYKLLVVPTKRSSSGLLLSMLTPPTAVSVLAKIPKDVTLFTVLYPVINT